MYNTKNKVIQTLSILQRAILQHMAWILDFVIIQPLLVKCVTKLKTYLKEKLFLSFLREKKRRKCQSGPSLTCVSLVFFPHYYMYPLSYFSCMVEGVPEYCCVEPQKQNKTSTEEVNAKTVMVIEHCL